MAPLQDWRAFYLDVNEIAAKAKDRAELERLLCERRDKRHGELAAAFKDISSKLLGSPRLLPGTWGHATDYLTKKSFDSLLSLFAHLAGPDVAPVLEYGPKTRESVRNDSIEPKHYEIPALTPSLLKKTKPRTKHDTRRLRGGSMRFRLLSITRFVYPCRHGA